ncbi:MAG: hypothetical protein AAF939_06180 [Planctomycetota bacterium]
MKGIMVSLLVFSMTGIVVGQQSINQNSSGIYRDSGVRDLIRPLDVKVNANDLAGLKQGQILEVSFSPKDADGQSIPKTYINGIQLTSSDLNIPPDQEVILRGENLGNGVLKIALTDQNLVDLQNKRLKINIPELNRGDFDSAEFYYARNNNSTNSNAGGNSSFDSRQWSTTSGGLSPNANSNSFDQYRTDASRPFGQQSTTPIANYNPGPVEPGQTDFVGPAFPQDYQRFNNWNPQDRFSATGSSVNTNRLANQWNLPETTNPPTAWELEKERQRKEQFARDQAVNPNQRDLDRRQELAQQRELARQNEKARQDQIARERIELAEQQELARLREINRKAAILRRQELNDLRANYQRPSDPALTSGITGGGLQPISGFDRNGFVSNRPADYGNAPLDQVRKQFELENKEKQIEQDKRDLERERAILNQQKEVLDYQKLQQQADQGRLANSPVENRMGRNFGGPDPMPNRYESTSNRTNTGLSERPVGQQMPNTTGDTSKFTASVNGPKEPQRNRNLDSNSDSSSSESKEVGLLYSLLLCSLGLNIYLALISRSQYSRYHELADELRETFTTTN